jgi:molybdate transport system substrate-binding protein
MTSQATIKVMSANSSRAVFDELMPQFERASGHKVTLSYDTGNLTLDRIKRGETADVLVLNTAAIDALTKEGKITGRRYELARCGVGVAVRSGAPKPDIGSVEALKSALLNAKSVAYTETGASGVHFAKVIEKLGIAAQIKAKSRTRPGGLIGELVASGEAEVAVQQIPELLAVAGIDLVGSLPSEVQLTSVVCAGAFAGSRQPEAARALLEFLASPAAALVFKAKGLEVG